MKIVSLRVSISRTSADRYKTFDAREGVRRYGQYTCALVNVGRCVRQSIVEYVRWTEERREGRGKFRRKEEE